MDYFKCLGNGLLAFGALFLEFFTPSTVGGHNFLNSISFLTIFNALEPPIRGVQVLFKHHKQCSPPLGFGLPSAFKCYNCNFNLQLKNN
jgi:hypothetical protein